MCVRVGRIQTGEVTGFASVKMSQTLMSQTLTTTLRRRMALASARRAGWGHHAISCVLEANEHLVPCEVGGCFKVPSLNLERTVKLTLFLGSAGACVAQGEYSKCRWSVCGSV